MKMQTMQRKAMIASLVGNSIFGFSFLASKVALNEVPPMVLLSARFLLATLILTALAIMGVIRIQLRGKNLKNLAFLGIFQPVIYFVFENYGVQLTNSAISGIIISLIPIVNFFMGSFVLKERFRRIQLAWAVVSVAGVCILSVNGSLAGGMNLVGLFCLFGAVLTASIFTVLSRSLANEFTPMERTFGMFVVGAVSFPVMGLVQTRGTLFGQIAGQLTNMNFVLPLLYLAVFSSIGAYFLLNYAVTYLPVRQSTSFTSITSVISVAAGAVVLHEAVSTVQYVGILMVLVGVYMVNQVAEPSA